MQTEMESKLKHTNQQNKPGSIPILKRLLMTGKKYTIWYVSLVIAALIVSAAELFEVEGLRRIINAATTKNNLLLVNGVMLSIAALVLGQIIEFFRSYFGELLDFISVRNLQSFLIQKIHKTIFKKYDAFHTGDLIDRIKNSSAHAQGSLNNNAVNILQKAVLIIFIVTYLLSVNIKLTIVALVFVVILPIIITPLSKKLKVLYDESMKLNADKSTLIQDVVQGSEIVKTYMLSGYFINSLESLYSKVINNVKRLIPYESFMYSANVMIIVLGDFAILAFGGYLASTGELKVGDVIAFVLLFEQLFQPISYISTIWPQFQASLASAGRIFEIMDMEEEDNEAGTPSEQIQSGDIKFDNVRFGYNDGEDILKGVSFTAKKGNVTAIVGPSGSGKSTIIKLVLNLYSPYSGKITYGGLEISKIKVSGWRSKLSYVSQDNSLFSGTVKENIVYGKLDAELEEVKEAARAANINELIESRNEGFDAIIGEKGIKLSGGERQRISIARTILANKDILILDEPTSALDNENEKIVMDALNNLMENKTTIVVAHRLSTIIKANEIIYLENGEVVESGSHNELIELKGRYYAMYNTMKEGATIC